MEVLFLFIALFWLTIVGIVKIAVSFLFCVLYGVAMGVIFYLVAIAILYYIW